jgi:hypothetical protein
MGDISDTRRSTPAEFGLNNDLIAKSESIGASNCWSPSLNATWPVAWPTLNEPHQREQQKRPLTVAPGADLLRPGSTETLLAAEPLDFPAQLLRLADGFSMFPAKLPKLTNKPVVLFKVPRFGHGCVFGLFLRRGDCFSLRKLLTLGLHTMI